jgi:hypothetical protein
MVWMIAPMQKISEARAIDQRRPKRAVKGQMKKHEKKAGNSQHCTQHDAAIRHTSGLEQTVGVGVDIHFGGIGVSEVLLERGKNQDTSNDTGVIGKQKGSYTTHGC